jgi:hypothetical protein
VLELLGVGMGLLRWVLELQEEEEEETSHF